MARDSGKIENITIVPEMLEHEVRVTNVDCNLEGSRLNLEFDVVLPPLLGVSGTEPAEPASSLSLDEMMDAMRTALRELFPDTPEDVDVLEAFGRIAPEFTMFPPPSLPSFERRPHLDFELRPYQFESFERLTRETEPSTELVVMSEEHRCAMCMLEYCDDCLGGLCMCQHNEE